MAISPASDIILDVARAADPQKAMATTRALDAGAGGDATSQFSRALDGLVVAPSHPDFSYRNPIASTLGGQGSAAQKAAMGLESVLLKSFIDQMLPKDAVDVFGGGVAGDVWRSMLSDKIADQVAKSGALKLGTRLFATHQDLLHSARQQKFGQFPSAPPTAGKV
ncbi:rod-binding protein [Rhodoblastus sp.]|uniref:rod-binding protein n=1 Tax=Rhodoblastus sp. TaxID=1962975 RepID=UPI003F9A39FC